MRNSQRLAWVICLVVLMMGVLVPVRLQAAPAIPAVAQKMEEFVQNGEVAGVVTLVADKQKILHLHAIGKGDISSSEPIRPDAIMWIASMTKPMTGAAVMMMVDEGKLSLDDLVEKHIPEFANLKTKEGKPAKVTIRHLLTHSSGMAEATMAESKACKTLAEMIPHYVSRPVQFEPGSKWQYCQSSINTAARVVEVVSGKTFDVFLQERLCGPLGMKDTTFYLSEEQLPRLAKSYRRTEGKLSEAPNFILFDKPATSRDRFPAANGGLFSTATDYVRFCQMLLNEGELDGKRYLKAESVKELARVQFPELKTGFTPGNGWGLGFCVVREPQGVTAMCSPGTYGHGGAYGTQAWIDPTKGLIFILMVQRANFPNADNSDARKVFQQAAVEAIEKK
jgi:CubicO group peptidase (beta-lactamase class C family)